MKNKVTVILSIIITLILMAGGSFLVYCCMFESRPMGDVRYMAWNTYDSYMEMEDDLVKMENELQDLLNIQQGVQFVFDVNIPNVSNYAYRIGGTAFHWSDTIGAKKYLYGREAFIEGFYSENSKFVVIFKDKADFSNSLIWIKSTGGDCYRYEEYYEIYHETSSYYETKEKYLLVDDLGNPVLGLKLVNIDEGIQEEIMNDLLEIALEEIKEIGR